MWEHPAYTRCVRPLSARRGEGGGRSAAGRWRTARTDSISRAAPKPRVGSNSSRRQKASSCAGSWSFTLYRSQVAVIFDGFSAPSSVRSIIAFSSASGIPRAVENDSWNVGIAVRNGGIRRRRVPRCLADGGFTTFSSLAPRILRKTPSGTLTASPAPSEAWGEKFQISWG